jgi:hypothetical protein
MRALSLTASLRIPHGITVVERPNSGLGGYMYRIGLDLSTFTREYGAFGLERPSLSRQAIIAPTAPCSSTVPLMLGASRSNVAWPNTIWPSTDNFTPVLLHRSPADVAVPILRPSVIWASGGGVVELGHELFQVGLGAKVYADLCSIVGTGRLNGRNPFAAIRAALTMRCKLATS